MLLLANDRQRTVLGGTWAFAFGVRRGLATQALVATTGAGLLAASAAGLTRIDPAVGKLDASHHGLTGFPVSSQTFPRHILPDPPGSM